MSVNGSAGGYRRTLARAGRSVCAVAQQELAAELDPRGAVVVDDVRRREGLGPFSGRNEPVPITSMGAFTLAMTRHLAGPKPELATIFTFSNPA